MIGDPSVTLYHIGVDYYPLVNASNTIDNFSCSVINGSGNYSLVYDIIDHPDSCFAIIADDVILDCQGHLIDGLDIGTGVSIVGTSSNVTIRNCRINDFNNVGFVGYANDSTIDNVTYSSGNNDGLWLYYSYNNTINSSNFSSSNFS